MTDMTSQTPMRDRKKQSSKGEYYAYFAILLALALPINLVIWLARIAMRKTTDGPIRMAWAQASTVTPKIFWA
ncbi:MAG: protein pufQ [Silicimonas sp.]|nr:protein pufQ [Silicimonas sp.]